jgi:hypothetical protein
MANEKGMSPVEASQNLLAELKHRAETAHKNGDVFTFKLMCELIKVTSPIVTRALARYHREERARINQLGQDLRGQTRTASPRNPEV